MHRGRFWAVVAVELAAVVALHRSGYGFEFNWSAPPEEAIGTLATAVALALGWWLALSATAYTVATGLGRPVWANVAGAVTAAPVRRLVGGALASSITVSSFAIPAVAGDRPLPPALVHLQDADAGGTHVVRPGDNLWEIARTRLAGASPDPTDAEVAVYWVQVVAANRATLRSGDPDLIYPGEVIMLP